MLLDGKISKQLECSTPSREEMTRFQQFSAFWVLFTNLHILPGASMMKDDVISYSAGDDRITWSWFNHVGAPPAGDPDLYF